MADQPVGNAMFQRAMPQGGLSIRRRRMDRPLHERIEQMMEVGECRLVSSLAETLRVKRSEIEDAVEDSRCLELLVGVGSRGGATAWKPSQWMVEKYDG